MLCSEFNDIYDEDHFITTLKGYVKVVSQVPDELMEKYDYNISNMRNYRIKAWATASYYLEEVYPLLQRKK